MRSDQRLGVPTLSDGCLPGRGATDAGQAAPGPYVSPRRRRGALEGHLPLWSEGRTTAPDVSPGRKDGLAVRVDQGAGGQVTHGHDLACPNIDHGACLL